MRDGTQAQAGMVHHFQGRYILYRGMGVNRISSPIRPSERGKRVVSPAGRFPHRSTGHRGNHSVAESRYWRARWIASTAGLATAAAVMIIHHLVGR